MLSGSGGYDESSATGSCPQFIFDGYDWPCCPDCHQLNVDNGDYTDKEEHSSEEDDEDGEDY